jgi:hypothetical protein
MIYLSVEKGLISKSEHSAWKVKNLVIDQSWYHADIAQRLDPFMKAIERKGVTVFAGAGISVAPPSSCPTWDNLKREILRSLLARLFKTTNIKKDLEDLSPAVMNVDMRPELFMSCMTTIINRSFIVEMLSGLNSGEPNLNHSLIAFLERKQIVKSIITTNFDNYIERELDYLGANYRVIRDDDEVVTQSMCSVRSFLVFKPHGCLSKSSSVRMRLDEIQSLSKPKKNLLQQLIKGVPLLIMGYSGNDEDFFPVLEESIQDSSTETCVIVYPGSRHSEPIQRLNLSKNKNLQLIISDPQYFTDC